MIEYKTHEFDPSLVDFSKEPETVGNMLENIVNNVLSGNKLATVGRCKVSFSNVKEPKEDEVGQFVTIPSRITFNDANGNEVSSGKVVLNGTKEAESKYNIHDGMVLLNSRSLIKLKKACTDPLKPEDIGLGKGAAIDLKHDKYGDQYHSWWKKKGKKVNSIECRPYGIGGKFSCYFYEPLKVVEKGIFAGLREPGVNELLVTKDYLRNLDTFELEGIGKKDIECELREYRHDPENVRQVRYVCKVK